MKFTEKSLNLTIFTILGVSIFIGVSSFDITKYQNLWSKAKTNLEQSILDLYTTTSSTLDSIAISPSPSATPKPYAYHPPTQYQKNYAIALGGILSRYNNESMVALRSSLNIAGLRPMMKESWNTFDHNSALETLDWLKMEGHRSEFENVYQVLVLGNITKCIDLKDSDPTLCRDQDLKDIRDIAIKVHEGVGDKSLIAWDFGRIVNVAKFSYSLGYITEEEAWKYIMPAAITIQKTYGSWEEYGNHYILGRAYWMRDTSANGSQVAILKYLLNPVNKTQWTTIEWNTKLD